MRGPKRAGYSGPTPRGAETRPYRLLQRPQLLEQPPALLARKAGHSPGITGIGPKDDPGETGTPRLGQFVDTPEDRGLGGVEISAELRLRHPGMPENVDQYAGLQ